MLLHFYCYFIAIVFKLDDKYFYLYRFIYVISIISKVILYSLYLKISNRYIVQN